MSDPDSNGQKSGVKFVQMFKWTAIERVLHLSFCVMLLENSVLLLHTWEGLLPEYTLAIDNLSEPR